MASQLSSVYVKDIQFRLEAVLKIFENNSNSKGKNLLTASKNHGLLFVANSKNSTLNVLLMSNLLDHQSLKNKIFIRDLQLPGEPKLIACNSDGEMLAASYGKDAEFGYLIVYNVASILEKEEVADILYHIRLDPNRFVLATDILWNPQHPNRLALITMEGRISFYDFQNHGKLETYSPEIECVERVKCGCWSPNGNKIVFGFTNGNIRVFNEKSKDDRTIYCPLHTYSMPFTAIAINWLLDQHKFVAASQPIGQEKMPSIYMVDASKAGTPIYFHYDDIIYCDECGGRSGQIHEICFHHISQWHLLIIMSANSSKISVIGTQTFSDDASKWRPYQLHNEHNAILEWKGNRCFPRSLTIHPLSKFNEENPESMLSMYLISETGELFVYSLLNLLSNAIKIADGLPQFQAMPETFFEKEQIKETEGNSSSEASSNDDTNDQPSSSESFSESEDQIKESQVNTTSEAVHSNKQNDKPTTSQAYSEIQNQATNLLGQETTIEEKLEKLSGESKTSTKESLDDDVYFDANTISSNSDATITNVDVDANSLHTWGSFEKSLQKYQTMHKRLSNADSMQMPSILEIQSIELDDIHDELALRPLTLNRSVKDTVSIKKRKISRAITDSFFSISAKDENEEFSLTSTTSSASTDEVELVTFLADLVSADESHDIPIHRRSSIAPRIYLVKEKSRAFTKATQVDSDIKLTRPFNRMSRWFKRKRQQNLLLEESPRDFSTQTDRSLNKTKWKMWFRKR